MKYINRTAILIVCFIAIFMSACVSKKKYRELQSRTDSLESEHHQLRALFDTVNSAKELLSIMNSKLALDTASLGISFRTTSEKYNQLNEDCEKLRAEYEALKSSNSDVNKKIIGKLQKTENDLILKEDSLKLFAKELRSEQIQLTLANLRLRQREAKLFELQAVLDKKYSTVKALKNAVSTALTGFNDKGLTVSVKNGKVYVSMEEKLLFASGSTVVDPKGVEALKEVAKVLEKNSDINVMIEGHTDNVPFIGGGALKDNWDLSVVRATSVIRILTSSAKIDQQRITAAGRGEYMPIDVNKTDEARRKNRRTEIILTPKLDELFKVIENN